MGQEPPRQPKSLAAAIPLITDAKADDWRGGSGPTATPRIINRSFIQLRRQQVIEIREELSNLALLLP
jgi:hypothetical protein